MGKIDYKYNEEVLIKELKEYVDATYGQHYAQSKFQTTEFIIDNGDGIGFTRGNIVKYAQRYGITIKYTCRTRSHPPTMFLGLSAFFSAGSAFSLCIRRYTVLANAETAKILAMTINQCQTERLLISFTF